MNVSPPLCEMLADKLIEERYTRHLENLYELAKKESARVSEAAPEFNDAAEMYVRNLSAALDLWNNKYQRNLINSFRELLTKAFWKQHLRRDTLIFAFNLNAGSSPRAICRFPAITETLDGRARAYLSAECPYESGLENLLGSGLEFYRDAHAFYTAIRARVRVHARLSITAWRLRRT